MLNTMCINFLQALILYQVPVGSGVYKYVVFEHIKPTCSKFNPHTACAMTPGQGCAPTASLLGGPTYSFPIATPMSLIA